MKRGVFIILFLLLIYTRLVGLGWGLPYPMHPDERNIAVAVTEISLSKMYSSNFWAYGGFQINLAFFLANLFNISTKFKNINITFEEAVMTLRVISAIASLLSVLVLIKIINFIAEKFSQNVASHKSQVIKWAILAFSPYFIQFSHFGTTESLLMLFYALMIYHSLKLLQSSRLNVKYLFLTSIFFGLALATKVSSAIFAVIVILAIALTNFARLNRKWLSKTLVSIICFLVISLIVGIIFSPHYLFYWKQFSNSLLYEKLLATGEIVVFYTRQFENTVPVWFQLTKIFPYALGWPQFILAGLGFIFLSWRKKEINLLRFAFLVYFLPNSILYTKWTRFMAPIFPIFSLFSLLFLTQLYEKMGKLRQVVVYVLVGLSIIPGIAYLSVYQNRDVRFTASDWIYRNISEGSYILSETANVVDIPAESLKSKVKSQKSYQVISFNFYDLDTDMRLQEELKNHLEKTDYIFVPSRRVFKNHPRSKYPRLNDYYQKLFSGELGFQKIAEFTSYPKIELFGKTLIECTDENAEETWSVFDHPVIRIYKRR